MTWHDKNIKSVLAVLAADKENGLSDKEAAQRLYKYGKNEITAKKKDGFWKKFSEQFKDFMIVILLLAAAISFITSIMNGDADYADPIIILGIVVFNALIGVIQENRAEKSIEALQKTAAPSARVKREKKAKLIDAVKLVPGDIVILKSGDKVSADCRILESTGVMTDESMLTGESTPAEKLAAFECDENTPLAERKNMLWSGSLIVAGRCEAVVCATGTETEMGNIASMIMSAQTRETPLQKKLSQIGKTLGIAALLICAAIFTIGILKSVPPFEMFMTAVSLAVAAIPEGLPAIVTIMLAIGVQRMAKKGAIIRNLPSVETLGSANVICSDKTGTLTENKMTVSEIYSYDEERLLQMSVLCSETESVNPTEAAIVTEAAKHGIKKHTADRHFPRIAEMPFSSESKRMSVLVQKGNEKISITKGAVDIVINMCGYIWDGKRTAVMTAGMKREIMKANEEMAHRALRVIAAAYREDVHENEPKESGLVFLGLIGMEDPPRKEVKNAVSVCREAGIIPVMITGDHPDTACAIAKQTGILTDCKKVMSGTEIDKMPQDKFEENIEDYSVFARVTPAHKVKIVKAWQKKGAVVAMTGDGVNDAPALKTADIGCSMGKGGTEVAKSASDMILTDDNFATIVKAVKEGRGIFENIKKAVQFLLSSNIGEILTVFLGLLFNRQTPLLAIQLLWINLVTDSLPAIALGVDPADKYIMNKPPRPAGKSLFADGLWLTIILEGAMIGACALLAFVIGSTFGDIAVARTMAFCVLSLSQLVHAFNMRSEHSVFSVGIFSNKYLAGAFLAGTLLQCSVVTFDKLALLFKVTPLDKTQWIYVAILSLMPLVIVEIQKFINRLLGKNTGKEGGEKR